VRYVELAQLSLALCTDSLLSDIQDIDRLIPREEMEKLKSALENAIKQIDPHFECEILGSYRRGVGFSSDIDLAVRHRDFVDKDDEDTGKVFINQIVQQLEEDGLIERENQLMLGPKKYAVNFESRVSTRAQN